MLVTIAHFNKYRRPAWGNPWRKYLHSQTVSHSNTRCVPGYRERGESEPPARPYPPPHRVVHALTCPSRPAGKTSLVLTPTVCLLTHVRCRVWKWRELQKHLRTCYPLQRTAVGICFTKTVRVAAQARERYGGAESNLSEAWYSRRLKQPEPGPPPAPSPACFSGGGSTTRNGGCSFGIARWPHHHHSCFPLDVAIQSHLHYFPRRTNRGTFRRMNFISCILS